MDFGREPFRLVAESTLNGERILRERHQQEQDRKLSTARQLELSGNEKGKE